MPCFKGRRLAAIAMIAMFPLAFAVPDAAGQASARTVAKERPDLTGNRSAGKTAPEVRRKSDFAHGRVYLLRGLANIFSRGMDTLGSELRKQGVDAVVMSHAHAFRVADELAAAYKTDRSVLPVVIIGHSLGANKALTMSKRLGDKGVPVRLVVLFDGTAKLPVPANVEEVLNFHNPRSIGVAVQGGRGFKGRIENRDLSKDATAGHVSIDKSAKLHAEVVEKVLKVLRERRFSRRR